MAILKIWNFRQFFGFSKKKYIFGPQSLIFPEKIPQFGPQSLIRVRGDSSHGIFCPCVRWELGLSRAPEFLGRRRRRRRRRRRHFFLGATAPRPAPWRPMPLIQHKTPHNWRPMPLIEEKTPHNWRPMPLIQQKIEVGTQNLTKY